MAIIVKSVRIDSNIEAVEEEMLDKVYSWLEAIGSDAASVARDFAPYDTGRLRNSISYEVEESEKAVYIGSNVEYAPYQELGTNRGIQGKHFLQFGATAHLEEYRDLLEQALKS